MIFRSLYAKLAVVLLGLLAVVGLLFVSISVYSTGMYQQEVNQKLNRTLAESIISRKIVMRNSLVDEHALREIFSMLMTINPSIEVYLLDPQGKILAYSADPGKVRRASVHLEPITRVPGGERCLPHSGGRSPVAGAEENLLRRPHPPGREAGGLPVRDTRGRDLRHGDPEGAGKLHLPVESLDLACRSPRDGDGGVGDAGLADAQTEASGRRHAGLFRGDRFRSAQSSRAGRPGARG